MSRYGSMAHLFAYRRRLKWLARSHIATDQWRPLPPIIPRPRNAHILSCLTVAKCDVNRHNSIGNDVQIEASNNKSQNIMGTASSLHSRDGSNDLASFSRRL